MMIVRALMLTLSLSLSLSLFSPPRPPPPSLFSRPLSLLTVACAVYVCRVRVLPSCRQRSLSAPLSLSPARAPLSVGVGARACFFDFFPESRSWSR